ncbi:hypothetical protein [Lysobacter gummosus]
MKRADNPMARSVRGGDGSGRRRRDFAGLQGLDLAARLEPELALGDDARARGESGDDHHMTLADLPASLTGCIFTVWSACSR